MKKRLNSRTDKSAAHDSTTRPEISELSCEPILTKSWHGMVIIFIWGTVGECPGLYWSCQSIEITGPEISMDVASRWPSWNRSMMACLLELDVLQSRDIACYLIHFNPWTLQTVYADFRKIRGRKFWSGCFFFRRHFVRAISGSFNIIPWPEY